MTAPSPAEQPSPDLYQILGLTPATSSAEITRAYRRLARRYHPDVDTTPGAAHRFTEITHAYRVLSDPGARARYDAARAPRRSRTSTGSHHASWSPPSTGRARPGSTPREALWLGVPTLTHAFHLGTDTAARPPPDEEAELELTLEESCHGTTRTVTVTSHDNTESVHVAVPPGLIDGDRIEVPTTHLAGGRYTPADRTAGTPACPRPHRRAPQADRARARALPPARHDIDLQPTNYHSNSVMTATAESSGCRPCGYDPCTNLPCSGTACLTIRNAAPWPLT